MFFNENFDSGHNFQHFYDKNIIHLFYHVLFQEYINGDTEDNLQCESVKLYFVLICLVSE